MTIHHFGYAVKKIPESISDFEKLGFKLKTEIFTDQTRNVDICFMEKDGVSIEVIAPQDQESPVYSLLKKNGSTLYHICYQSNNFEEDICRLKKDGFLVVEEPKEAIAIECSRVAFLYKNSIGLLEVVEKEKDKL